MIRAKAAGVLAWCNTAAAEQALREALLDRSVIVQEAAEASLQTLADSTPAPTAGEATSAVPSPDSEIEETPA